MQLCNGLKIAVRPMILHVILFYICIYICIFKKKDDKHQEKTNQTVCYYRKFYADYFTSHQNTATTQFGLWFYANMFSYRTWLFSVNFYLYMYICSLHVVAYIHSFIWFLIQIHFIPIPIRIVTMHRSSFLKSYFLHHILFLLLLLPFHLLEQIEHSNKHSFVFNCYSFVPIKKLIIDYIRLIEPAFVFPSQLTISFYDTHSVAHNFHKMHTSKMTDTLLHTKHERGIHVYRHK